MFRRVWGVGFGGCSRLLLVFQSIAEAVVATDGLPDRSPFHLFLDLDSFDIVFCILQSVL